MAYTVNTYKSPDDLAAAIGAVVISGLDDVTVGDNYAVGDVVVTWGGTYTLIKNPSVDFIILPRGGFYAVINKNA